MLMMVTEVELSSFLTKFKHLCNAGFEASLQLTSRNGYATVSLEVALGPLESTSNTSNDVKSPLKPKRKRSPAYFRRQEIRRNAAKHLSTTAAVEVVVDTEDTDIDHVNSSLVNEALWNEADTEQVSTEENIMAVDSLRNDVYAENREEVPQDAGSLGDSRDLSMQLEHIIKESERNRNIWDKMKAMPSEMDNLLLRECEEDLL